MGVVVVAVTAASVVNMLIVVVNLRRFAIDNYRDDASDVWMAYLTSSDCFVANPYINTQNGLFEGI